MSRIIRAVSLITVLLMLVSIIGCGTTTSEDAGKKEGSGAKQNPETKEVTIAYIAMANTSPQAMIGIKEKIFEKVLGEQGYKVNWVITRSNDKVYPMMDKGEADFVYLPSQNVFTYMAENTEFGGSDKFRIVSGSLNNNSFILMVNSDVKSLKDLDGKTVGVANHFYMEEMLLNRQLESVGLKTKVNGGTVNIEYLDWMNKIFESFKSGKYAAITSWNSLEKGVQKQVPGSKLLINLNDGAKFGERVPQKWLLAKKELIDNNPDLVKAVLKAHVEATEKAIQAKDQLPVLSEETWNNYHTEVMKAAEFNRYPKAFYEKEWRASEPTYDPNLKFIEETYDFMIGAGYLKDKSMDNLVDIQLLNEVLKEQGKDKVK